MRILTIATFSFFLAGCAVQQAEKAQQARSTLIGKSRVELLSCAGVPARQTTDGNMEFLTYSAVGRRAGLVTIGQTSPSTMIGTGVSRQFYCEATFVLIDGKVTRINYAGPTGALATQGEACFPIIENCVN